MAQTPSITILYDSISNAVFYSQVLTPLINQRTRHPNQPIYLISFERKPSRIYKNYSSIIDLCARHDITLCILKRYPTVGIRSVRYTARQLRTILQRFSAYTLTARGPLAGIIATSAATPSACTQLIIQARGLLAQEYAYTHSGTPTSLLSYCWHRWRFKQLETIEKVAFGTAHPNLPITIQAVTPALATYLMQTFMTPPDLISIADHDIPEPVPSTARTTWRTKLRAQLGISHNAHVYCYNGSAKAWQCPELIIECFANLYPRYQRKKQQTHLLILTNDTKPFITLLNKYKIPQQLYHVLSVDPAELNNYLTCADTGLILRRPHIVNWVARPTKALEYHAAGLTVLHNATVAWLNDAPFDTTTGASSCQH